MPHRSWNKGNRTTPDNPGDSALMLWIRDHRDYQGDDCLIWPFTRASSGYGSYGRGRRKFYVHRYMCEFRNGPPPSPKHHAAHSCGRGQDGCANPRHLDWKTNAENQLDRHQHGTAKKVGLKLTEELAAEIRGLKDVELPRVTAARLGVSETNVRQVQSGKIWGANRKYKITQFSPGVIATIRALYQTQTARQIAESFGVSQGVIYRAVHSERAISSAYRQGET